MDEYPRFGSRAGSEFEAAVGELLHKSGRMLAAQERMRRLLRANQVVFEGLELERVLRHIAETAVSAFDAPYGALWLIDEDQIVDPFFPIDMPEHVVALYTRSHAGEAAFAAVTSSQAPVALTDGLERADGTEQAGDGSAPEAFLGIPVRVGGDAYGALFLASREAESFSDDDRELLGTLASTAAIAISNARQFEESKRSQRLAAVIGDVAAALLSTDPGSPFGIVAEGARSLVDADLTTIVGRASHGRLGVLTARGQDASAVEGTVLEEDVPLMDMAIAGESTMSADHWLSATAFGGLLDVGSTIAVPFSIPGGLDTALSAARLGDHPPFTAPDLALLSEFAAQSAAAVAMSHTRAEQQRLALTEERARIARDLHDHVIQRLYAVGLSLRAFVTGDPGLSTAIDIQIDDIDTAIADIRTAIFALQSPTSHSARHRILDAAAAVTPQLGSTPHLTFSGPIDLVVVDELADDVVAVIRESFANVIRHAHAKTTQVTVDVTSTDVTVIIDDDGIGPPARPSRASGTANLATRAEARGGMFALERGPFGGTRTVWSVPISGTAGVGRR